MYTWRLGTSYIVTYGDIHTCCVATVLVGSAVVFVLLAIVVRALASDTVWRYDRAET